MTQKKKKDNTTMIVLLAVGGLLLFQCMPFILVIGLYVMMGIAGGGVFGFIYFFQPGQVHVHCLEGEDSFIMVDDGEPELCLSGSYKTVEAERGPHVVRIKGQKTLDEVGHAIEIKGGFHELVVPAHVNQCFVLLDMTDYEYRTVYIKGEGRAPPTIDDIYDTGEPFEKPSNTYMSYDTLPEYLGDAGYVNLLVDLPCDQIEKSDEEILLYLGYP
jgi:hypothetical protein